MEDIDFTSELTEKIVALKPDEMDGATFIASLFGATALITSSIYLNNGKNFSEVDVEFLAEQFKEILLASIKEAL